MEPPEGHLPNDDERTRARYVHSTVVTGGGRRVPAVYVMGRGAITGAGVLVMLLLAIGGAVAPAWFGKALLLLAVLAGWFLVVLIRAHADKTIDDVITDAEAYAGCTWVGVMDVVAERRGRAFREAFASAVAERGLDPESKEALLLTHPILRAVFDAERKGLREPP